MKVVISERDLWLSSQNLLQSYSLFQNSDTVRNVSAARSMSASQPIRIWEEMTQKVKLKVPLHMISSQSRQSSQTQHPSKPISLGLTQIILNCLLQCDEQWSYKMTVTAESIRPSEETHVCKRWWSDPAWTQTGFIEVTICLSNPWRLSHCHISWLCDVKSIPGVLGWNLLLCPFKVSPLILPEWLSWLLQQSPRKCDSSRSIQL